MIMTTIKPNRIQDQGLAAFWKCSFNSKRLSRHDKDFQYAEESNFKEESSIRFASEPDFEPPGTNADAPQLDHENIPGYHSMVCRIMDIGLTVDLR